VTSNSAQHHPSSSTKTTVPNAHTAWGYSMSTARQTGQCVHVFELSVLQLLVYCTNMVLTVQGLVNYSRVAVVGAATSNNDSPAPSSVTNVSHATEFLSTSMSGVVVNFRCTVLKYTVGHKKHHILCIMQR